MPGHEDRITAIAKEYAKSPDNTLVVSPDNRSRAEINQAIHAELQAKGVVGKRVLIYADTELGAKDLLNNRMAYVAVSRGAYDAQIFTNDREKLGAALGHDVSHSAAPMRRR